MNDRAWDLGPGAWGAGNHAPGPRPQAPFRYTEAQPSPAIAGLVLSYWSFQSDAPPPYEPYTVFPDGCASVACVRSGQGPAFIALVGPRVTHFTPPFGTGTRIWGIRFWPDAIGPALGVSAPTLRDFFGGLPPDFPAPFAELDAVLPRSDDTDVVFRALDAWTTATLAQTVEPDPRIRAAVRAIVAGRGEGSMEDVARQAAIGLRHLQRLFREATGLTLREYARVRRLREALAMRLTPSSPRWSQIAAGTGFVDHAHLTREFVALAGAPPSVAAEQMSMTAHRGVRP